ncbi:TRAP transporter substrate-binding protein DctP, partial [Chloroflexota bacterium]
MFEWKWQSTGTSGSTAYEYQALTIAHIERMTAGQIKIEQFATGAIVAPPEALEAMSKGVLTGYSGTSTYWSGTVPISNLESIIPGTLKRPEDMYTFLYDPDYRFIDIINEAYVPFNVVHVGETYALGDVFNSNVPIRKVEDFQGMKIRSSGGSALLLTELGCSPTYFAAQELYQAMATGIIDGFEYAGLELNMSIGFYEVTDYLHQPAFQPVYSSPYLLNLEAWNEIPDNF